MDRYSPIMEVHAPYLKLYHSLNHKVWAEACKATFGLLLTPEELVN